MYRLRAVVSGSRCSLQFVSRDSDSSLFSSTLHNIICNYQCTAPGPSSRGAGAPGYSPSAGTATPHSSPPPYTILYVTINVPPQGRRLREQVQPTVRQQGQRFLTLLLHNIICNYQCTAPGPSSRGAGAPGYSPSAGTGIPRSSPPPYTTIL